MFKRITMVAAAAALAIVMTPAASEAGTHHKREARSGCALTKLMHRARPARTVKVVKVHARPARVHVRKARVVRVHKKR